MGPVGRVALHDAGDDGRAWRVHQAALAGVAQQLVVARHDGVLQEADRVGQAGLGVALVQGRHGLQGELRGHLTLGVTTHAVGEGEQT